MAIVTQVQVSFTGNRWVKSGGSVTHSMGLTIDLDDADDYEAVYREYAAKCKAIVTEDIKRTLNGENTPKTAAAPVSVSPTVPTGQPKGTSNQAVARGHFPNGY